MRTSTALIESAARTQSALVPQLASTSTRWMRRWTCEPLPMVDIKAQLDVLIQQYDEIRVQTEHDDLSGGNQDTARKTMRYARARLRPRRGSYRETPDTPDRPKMPLADTPEAARLGIQAAQSFRNLKLQSMPESSPTFLRWQIMPSPTSTRRPPPLLPGLRSRSTFARCAKPRASRCWRAEGGARPLKRSTRTYPRRGSTLLHHLGDRNRLGSGSRNRDEDELGTT
jgi:hypothetical protein